MGANDELWQMYQKETSVDVKRQILSAMQVGGNTTRMIEIAKTEKDPELRRIAVRNLGVMGAEGRRRRAGRDLRAPRRMSPFAAPSSTRSSRRATPRRSSALARKEPDFTMKKEMVQRLSTMDNKVARDYMLELLK